MKTTKERAIEIVQQMRTNMDIPVRLEEGLIGRIDLALRDQDKITRNAVIEEVKTVKPFVLFLNDTGLAREDVIQAIMNTKTV